jgi:hypothetical protein
MNWTGPAEREVLRPGRLRPYVLALQIDAYLTQPADPAPGWLDSVMRMLAITDMALELDGTPIFTRTRKALARGLEAGLAVAENGMAWKASTAPALDEALEMLARQHEILPSHLLSRAVLSLEAGAC